MFAPEIIQPLFDLADPKNQPAGTASAATSNGTAPPKQSPQTAAPGAPGTKTEGTPKWPETAGSTPRNQVLTTKIWR